MCVVDRNVPAGVHTELGAGSHHVPDGGGKPGPTRHLRLPMPFHQQQHSGEQLGQRRHAGMFQVLHPAPQTCPERVSLFLRDLSVMLWMMGTCTDSVLLCLGVYRYTPVKERVLAFLNEAMKETLKTCSVMVLGAVKLFITHSVPG